MRTLFVCFQRIIQRLRLFVRGPQEFHTNQLVWLGEFICRIKVLDKLLQRATIYGGPVLLEDDAWIDLTRFKYLGIGGYLQVLFDSSQSCRYEWVRHLVFYSRCSRCRKKNDGLECPDHPHAPFSQHGLQVVWIDIYMTLWLYGEGTRQSFWKNLQYRTPKSVAHQIRCLGRWLWCSQWRSC